MGYTAKQRRVVGKQAKAPLMSYRSRLLVIIYKATGRRALAHWLFMCAGDGVVESPRRAC